MTRNTANPLRQMVYAALFGALTAIGSYIIIPLPLSPVPITLQTFFTGLAGALLGSYTGALSQIVYVLLGLIGLPVFSGGKAGLGILLGPTGGYLIGFILGAYVIGKIVEAKRDAGYAWTVLAVLVGFLVIYTLGVTQLALVGHLSIIKALLLGMVNFLIGDALKIAAIAWITPKLRKNIRQ